ncbi:MAG: hypothetical protein IJ309_06750 [Clostridia bacterium]|nr:hypothetical protein [Clostridia bacterium]
MKKFTLFDLMLMTMYGALMYLLDIGLEFLPNVHGVAMLICTITLIYRYKALLAIGVYLALTAFTSVSAVLWWVPYVYIFPLLWLCVMLIPKRASLRLKIALSTVFAGLNGLLFGTLYAPYQAILMGYDWQKTFTWILVGLPWDVVHMCSNIVMCALIYPLYTTITKLEATRISKR